MLTCYKLIGYEAYGPEVNGLAICSLSKHLFWCLVHKCPTSLIKSMLKLYLNSKTKVNNLHCFKILYIINYDVTWFQVSMNEILAVNVFHTKKYPFDNLSALVI